MISRTGNRIADASALLLTVFSCFSRIFKHPQVLFWHNDQTLSGKLSLVHEKRTQAGKSTFAMPSAFVIVTIPLEIYATFDVLLLFDSSYYSSLFLDFVFSKCKSAPGWEAPQVCR
ncbi:hypothetical protein AVEN_114789-1 [Araneus ventricosus]|uniref:Uncharacterized protein n=1 Tax=Araneus ventricosus TaxID=182803 RepID=A0A4Y2QLI6_ARAVE|nr:hypothetical protein AVEN_86184-1 [Araneus ventricosus]GBN64143.1 hypothetical protein AVEN_114789-1 [Araneus ventricosus]